MCDATIGNRLVDTHCHLDFPQFDDDRPDALLRAEQAGVAMVVDPGTDVESSARAVSLAQQLHQVYAAVGVHPHEATAMDADTLEILIRLAASPKVVAWGEIGLDYFRDHSPRDRQRQVFERQLEVARDLGLPVIVHLRDAWQDGLTILRRWARGGHPGCVLHAFSGNRETVKEAIDLGFHFGIGGPVTYRNAASLLDIVPTLPPDRLLLETDAPYLTPHPYRGRRNEPAYVALVAQTVAVLLGRSLNDVAERTTTNACRLFGLPRAEA